MSDHYDTIRGAMMAFGWIPGQHEGNECDDIVLWLRERLYPFNMRYSMKDKGLPAGGLRPEEGEEGGGGAADPVAERIFTGARFYDNQKVRVYPRRPCGEHECLVGNIEAIRNEGTKFHYQVGGAWWAEDQLVDVLT